MDVKLKRRKRFSAFATVGAFVVGLVVSLLILWATDRPSSGSGSGATATTATPGTTATGSRPVDTTTGTAAPAQTAEPKSVSTSSATTPVVRLVKFDPRPYGENTVLVWDLSAPLGSAAVWAETTGGISVLVQRVGGTWRSEVRGMNLDSSAVPGAPVVSGSSVELSIPTKAFGDLPVEITPGIIPEGDSVPVTGKPVTLG
jgi:hypothetical protein